MRVITTSMILSAMIAVGCSSEKPEPTDDFSSLDGVDEKADSFSSHMKIVGALSYGQTSDDVAYSKTPRYRTLEFSGAEGDVVDVWVRSQDGDAVAWVLDSHYKILGKNDDADATTFDAHITLTLGKSASKTHYIVFREYASAKAVFSVELNGGNPMFACQVDADCVAVSEAGCCPGGLEVAVATGHERAYADAHVCATPMDLCPKAVILDRRAPECDFDSRQCVMVAPEDIRCHGFTRNPHECPDGYTCKLNIIPDIPGTCVAS